MMLSKATLNRCQKKSFHAYLSSHSCWTESFLWSLRTALIKTHCNWCSKYCDYATTQANTLPSFTIYMKCIHNKSSLKWSSHKCALYNSRSLLSITSRLTCFCNKLSTSKRLNQSSCNRVLTGRWTTYQSWWRLKSKLLRQKTYHSSMRRNYKYCKATLWWKWLR